MTTTDTSTKTVEIPRVLSVKELGDLLAVSPVEVIKELMKNGVMASINQVKRRASEAMRTGMYGTSESSTVWNWVAISR